MKKLATCTIWTCWSSCTNCVFVSYEKWVQREKCPFKIRLPLKHFVVLEWENSKLQNRAATKACWNFPRYVEILFQWSWSWCNFPRIFFGTLDTWCPKCWKDSEISFNVWYSLKLAAWIEFWPSMNRRRMLFVQTSTPTLSMHRKLTQHGRYSSMQNNKLPTKMSAWIALNSSLKIKSQITSATLNIMSLISLTCRSL